jgi:uridine phosphorylase
VTDTNYVAPHIKVGPGVVRPTVIVVGDPFRCEVVAKLCDKYEEVQWNREYRLYNVTYHEEDLSICSHGIGGPGAAICFEELIKLGAKTIIRLGTSGALQTHIKTGDLIVASGACREDGLSDFIAPKGYPALGDNELTLALYNQGKAMDCTVHLGVALTNAMFYVGNALPPTLRTNADAGALMVEMEVASLFIVGSHRGIRTAAIATADGNLFNEGDYDPHGAIVAENKVKMLKIGLNVAKQAAMEDKLSEPAQVFDS